MPGNIFVSYSHRDERWLQKISTHLSVANATRLLDIWADTKIKAGELWYDEITAAIDRSDIAVLLISADFLASDFIRTEELPRLFNRRQNNELELIPVLVRPCPYQQVEWIAKRQLRPRGAVALSSKTDSEAEGAIVEIANEIAAIGQGRAALQTTLSGSAHLRAAPAAKLIIERASKDLNYFFYISTERILNLFAQIPASYLLEQAIHSNPPTASANGSCTSNLATGRFSVATSNLVLVLRYLESESRIGDITNAVSDNVKLEFPWHHVSAVFRCELWNSDSKVIVFSGKILDYEIVLPLTKQNVVGLNREGDEWIPTSVNYFVFNAISPIALSGLVRIVSVERDRKKINAVPLYLAMEGPAVI